MKCITPRTIVVLFILLALCATVHANTGVVTKVFRGDLVLFGESWDTRLVGLRGPAPDEFMGPEALAFTKDRVEGKRVQFATWTRDNTAAGIVYDQDRRPFAEIWIGENYTVELNAELLKRGLARVDEAWLPEDKSYYRDLEKQAREAKVGIWADREQAATGSR